MAIQPSCFFSNHCAQGGQNSYDCNGITVLKGSVVQPDGTFGYTTTPDRGVDVEIVNTLDVPATIHWHGLYISHDLDGIPFVTQPPIPLGAI